MEASMPVTNGSSALKKQKRTKNTATFWMMVGPVVLGLTLFIFVPIIIATGVTIISLIGGKYYNNRNEATA